MLKRGGRRGIHELRIGLLAQSSPRRRPDLKLFGFKIYSSLPSQTPVIDVLYHADGRKRGTLERAAARSPLHIFTIEHHADSNSAWGLTRRLPTIAMQTVARKKPSTGYLLNPKDEKTHARPCPCKLLQSTTRQATT